MTDLDELPLYEGIHLKKNQFREARKKQLSGSRRGLCYKHSYSRKQALTQMNTLLKRKAVFLRVYKCVRCRAWHLTKQAERPKSKLQ